MTIAGNEKAKRRIEAIVTSAKLISPELLTDERNLMTSKWYAYRFMSPLEATELFARQYREAFRGSFRQNVDAQSAGNVRGVAHLDRSKPSKTFTQVWKARQRADELGVPYREYLWFSFDFWTRRERRKLPQPNQLHPTGRSVASWTAAFNDWWEEGLEIFVGQLRGLPQYRIENYHALPAQDSFRAFLVDHAKSGRTSLGSIIRDRCIVEQQIPPEMFDGHFDPDILRRETERAVVERDDGLLIQEPAPQMDRSDMWPACFGVPHARSETSPVCLQCPQSGDCIMVSEAVFKAMEQRFGTRDPRKAKTRNDTRLRVAAHRARKKAAERAAQQMAAPSDSTPM